MLSLLYLGVKAQQYIFSSSRMSLDKKTLLKTRLNPGLNLTIFRGTGPRVPVVELQDSTIHWINHHPEYKYWGNQLQYALDSDLSSGERYPPFEQLVSGCYLVCTACM